MSELHLGTAELDRSGPDEARPTRQRYVVLASACALALVTYLLRVGFSAVGTELRTDLGLSQDHLGSLMAAFMIAYGIFEVPWGLAGDRFGVRGPLSLVALGGALTTGLLAIAALLPGVTWIFAALLLLRGLFGAFQAGTFPLVSRMITDWMPTTERGSAQGFIWMSSRFGGSIAPLMLIPLFQLLNSWKSPLVIAAVIAGSWALFFFPWFRNQPEDSQRVNAAERELITSGRASRSAGHGATPWGRMLRSRSVWALCIMYGGLGYTGNFFLTLLKDYLTTQRALPLDTVKWLTALPYVCGVVACLAGGWLSDVIIRRTGRRNLGRRAVGIFGLLMGAVAILATVWVENVYLLGLLLCITFTGNDLSMGPAWAAAADKGERHSGTLSGLMNMVASFSGAVMSKLTGAMLSADYQTLPFVVFFLAYGVGALAWLFVDVTETLGDHEPPIEHP